MRQFVINALVVLSLPIIGYQYEQDRSAALQSQVQAAENAEIAAAAAKLAEANKRIAGAVQASDAAKASGLAHTKAVFDSVPEINIPGHVSFSLLGQAPKALKSKGNAVLPAEIQALDGKQVTITGFLLVLFPVEPIREAVLAKNPWDECCLGTPPTLFDSVEVKMREDKPLKKARIRIGSLTGTLRAKPAYGDGGQLEGLYVLDDAYETELSAAASAGDAAGHAAGPAPERRLLYLLAMPALLVLAVINNLIPSRRPTGAAGAGDVVMSLKKFSIED